MWLVVDDYPSVERAFLNVMDKDMSIVKIVNAYSFDDGSVFQVARYVSTLYDVTDTVKRGVRIELVRMPSGDYDADWLDSLFIEGKPYEAVRRSALRYAARAKNRVYGTADSSKSVSYGVVNREDIMSRIAVLLGVNNV